MLLNNILKIGFVAFLLSTQLNAQSKPFFAEFKYNIMDGKANSYVDTASDSTKFIALKAGKYLDEYPVRLSLEYDPIRWKDAQVDIITLNAEYVNSINKDLQYFAGVGIGRLHFQGDPINYTGLTVTSRVQAGLIYDINKNIYLTSDVQYIYTNDAKIQDNAYSYSYLDNFFGMGFGVGVKF